VDGLKRLLAPLTASSESYLLFDVKNARKFNRGEVDWDHVGIKAIDSLDVEITLLAPVREWERALAVRATFPVREDLIRSQGSLWQKPGNLVNLGPFVLESHEFGSSVVLKRNPRWPRQGNVDRIEFKVLSSSEASTAFNQKQLELLIKVPAELRKSYDNRSELKWLPPVLTKRLSFNLERFPTADASIREMIASAINRAELAKSLGPGHRAGGTLVPPDMTGFLSSGGHAFDLADAKRILTQNLGSLTSAHLTLLVPAFDENTHENVSTAKFIQSALQKNLHLAVSSRSWMTRENGRCFREADSSR
jgi:oligopeptide transport system substrate-binding protein